MKSGILSDINFRIMELSSRIGTGAVSLLTEIDRFFKENGIEVYLVGGFVRDLLIARPTADIDLAIRADANVIGPQMASVFKATSIPLDAEHGICRLVISSCKGSQNQWYIDLSSIKTDIEADLARRDFSIDAIAVKPGDLLEYFPDLPLLDPFNGRQDLEQGTIRAINNRVFLEDPARLMRAIRLAAELDFTIDPETAALLKRDSSLLVNVAGERCREELQKILSVKDCGPYFHLMDNLGLLTSLIPELEAARGIEQPREHYWDVLEHCIQTVYAAGYVTRRSDWKYGSEATLAAIPWSEKLEKHFASEVVTGSSRESLLKLAALLHDIAKPETKIIADNKIRFYGHNKQGADVVAAIMARLRFSNREISVVETLVRQHMRPTQMSHEGKPTRKAVYRFFRDTGNAGIDVLFLSLADHLAARGPDLDREQWQWHIDQVKTVLDEYFNNRVVIAPPRVVDGHDLINLFGLKPGPQIRTILEAIREAQADGEICTRDEALSYVENRLLYKERK